ncbi:dihydrolipoyl dehydrogenase [Halorientalis sp.]|jgi:dihydrolipoamide dehydrogenase|uniref:dihydrolipoyl dehydrogenase n=1 Tax=Halorientalis sp. TaxID=1931229 RepID=UPI0026077504|nr:dihydrolipoyl dehydrogenase [Halorientalis sp.]
MCAAQRSSTDLLIIGAGPGGYVAAIRAGQHGRDVTMVERDAYGGACLNRGCIPSKALVSAADLVHQPQAAGQMGIDATVEVDFEQLQAWQHDVVDQLTGGVEQLCEANGVTLVSGTATFESPHEVAVDGGDGPDSIEFESAVIATGSRPVTIPGFEPDGDRVVTSADVFSLEELPDSMLVVGGGYIGMELATVFQKLGTNVTVFEMLDSVLPAYGEAVTSVVVERAATLGVDIHTGATADELVRKQASVEVTTTDEDGPSRFEADRLLVATGREPVTDTLELGATEIRPTDDGFIETDRHGRTVHDHIYAVGDVTGDPMLAHRASRQGEIVADHVAGEASQFDYRVVPAVVFTDPEIATAGLTEADATEEGYEPIVGEFPLSANGRSLTLNAPDGFVRLVADADTERVLGGQIVGPEASELIGEVTLAIEVGARLEDLVATIHTHPTLSEAVMEAAANAREEAIHIPNQ